MPPGFRGTGDHVVGAGRAHEYSTVLLPVCAVRQSVGARCLGGSASNGHARGTLSILLR